MLWRDLAVQRRSPAGTNRVCIGVAVEGAVEDRTWSCDLQFDYGNSEVFYCRPAPILGHADRRTLVPLDASLLGMAYIPPLSGVIADKVHLAQGAINVRLGEGRTAELLRNMCFGVLLRDSRIWEDIAATVDAMFGVRLNEPYPDVGRGEVALDYQCGRSSLDIAGAGHGLRQALFLMACVTAHPNSVLLLDAPDIHVDPACWLDIYGALKSFAGQTGSQIIATGHSESLLNAALHHGDEVVEMASMASA